MIGFQENQSLSATKEEIKNRSLLLGATSNQLQNKYNNYFKYPKSKLYP
jgi:hypothetical protein